MAARSGSFSRDLDARCLLAFPQAREMHGVFDSKNVAATATPPNRWRDLRMCERHLLEAGDVAIICYRAAVTRADGQPYAALVSSGHVRRTDGCGSLANLPRGSLQTPQKQKFSGYTLSAPENRHQEETKKRLSSRRSTRRLRSDPLQKCAPIRLLRVNDPLSNISLE